MPKVVVILLNWNGLKDTLECLDSVYRLAYPNLEIIVVDNGSSDNSVVTINNKFPQVILIENSKNLGYTGGNNIGIRHALKHGADYVWLLNNDTVVERDSLIKLVEAMEQSPEIGLASPVIRYYCDRENVEFMGAYVDFSKFKITVIEKAELLEKNHVQRNLILWGTALLIKKEVVETVGYLSEKYFAYVEDCDYSVRALRANYLSTISLDSNVYHKGARATGKNSPIKIFLGTRNQYFLWRDNTFGLRNLLVLGNYLGMVINYAKCLTDEGHKLGLDACLNGAWAAFRRIGGEYDPEIVMPLWLRRSFCFFISWQPYFWVKLFRGDFTGILRSAFTKAQSRIYKARTRPESGW